ncbi:MAG: hypothetical protein ACJ74W_22865 [Pyrinomonadaceae bacterium]
MPSFVVAGLSATTPPTRRYSKNERTMASFVAMVFGLRRAVRSLSL